MNRPPLPPDLIERENAARLAALQDETTTAWAARSTGAAAQSTR